MQIKKNAVDLTELAIGVLVLGIVTAIGTKILITQRDSRLTDLDVITVTNESLTSVASGSTKTLTNVWVSSITGCKNATGGEAISTGNYTTQINSIGQGKITPTAACAEYNGTNWKCDYKYYNTSRADWALADEASVGIGEYGNWFKTIVIVGVAAVVLTLIFMSFGRGTSLGTGSAGSGEGSY